MDSLNGPDPLWLSVPSHDRFLFSNSLTFSRLTLLFGSWDPFLTLFRHR